MTVETTYDDNGNVLSQHIKPNTYTISFGKKIGKPNYGNEEFSIFAQLDVLPNDTLDDLEAKIKETAAFVKGVVFQQLGLMHGVDERTGVVQAVEDAMETKPAGRPSPPRRAGTERSSGGNSDALWQDLFDNKQQWYDNRGTKTNPRGPDFKRKSDGQALWINSAPSWFDWESFG